MKRVALLGLFLVCLLLSFAADASAQSNSAAFVRTDTTSAGNWPSKYGSDGYSLPQPTQSLPANVTSFAVESAAYWAWATTTTDPRALQTPGGGPSQATTWYSGQTFTVDITVASGQMEQIVLYAIDWDSQGRSEIFNVVDGDTNAPLNSQTVSNFANGVYLIWNISGHIKINISQKTGPNAVLSGVFFESPSISTIRVPQDQPTIQAAINAATNGQTVLVSPGTYHENINFLGKAITVTSSAGPATTIIDGGSNGTVITFDTNEGSSSVLNGFTLQHGLNSSGGGIQIWGASPTITDNIVTQNRAPVGLGIFVNDGSPLIQNNQITGNNVQYGDGGQGGGGIVVSADSSAPSTPQIIGNTITNNSVASGGDGGGISVGYFTHPTIRGNLIANNTAYNDGGGIALESYNGVTLVENVIVNNSSLAGRGGGLFLSSFSTAAIIVENNTIAANSASDLVSGITLSSYGQAFEFISNIVAASAGQVAIACDGSLGSVSPYFAYNDAYAGGQSAWSGACDFTSNPGNISADPLFANQSASNFHLLPSSPAVNAGFNAAPNLPTTDFDGNNRIFNATVDLGAYEYSGLTTYTLSPPSITFPDQLVGTASQSVTVTLTNTGAIPLQSTAIATNSPDFPESDNCASSTGLLAGQSCQITVQFKPGHSGQESSSITASANVLGYAISILVSGNGTGSAPTATASLVGTDTTTLGNWQSNYGADGYSIANAAQNLPSYAFFSNTQDLTWTWAANTTDPRALRLPGGANGPATTWYTPSSLFFDLNLTDGNTHQVALYALDWDMQGRTETISIFDAESNAVLASTSVSNFSNGIYVIFNISGHVHISVTFTSGPNPVISGILFGGSQSAPPPTPPSLTITKSHTGHVTQGQQGLVYTITVSNAANTGPTSGPVSVEELLPNGLSLVSMSGDGWSCSTNAFVCTRTDTLNPALNYSPITVAVNVAANATSPQVNKVTVSGGGSLSANATDSTIIESSISAGTAATFIGLDSKTQGAWQSVYGTDGYSIENSAQSTPAYAPSVTVQNGLTWTWAATTSDPRALQELGVGAGTATTWFNPQSFSFDMNFIDGQSHYIALYAVDWDSQGRSETIQILDANSNTQLDSRLITTFSSGVYLVWKVSGHVTITVTSNAGPNAVVSGVFFGLSITYTFSGSNTALGGDGLPVGFRFVSNGFVQGEVPVYASELASCTNCYNSPYIPAVVFHPANAGVDTIDFDDIENEGPTFAFPLGSLGQPGTYNSSLPFNPGILTIKLGNF